MRFGINRRGLSRSLAWTLFLTAAGAATFGTLAAKGTLSAPLTTVAIMVLAAVGFVAPLLVEWVKTDAKNLTEQRSLVRKNCLVTKSGRPPRVSDLHDPLALGIHPAAFDESGPLRQVPKLPPYVTRDEDKSLDELIKREPFVILSGASAAGKSRTLFECVRRNFAKRRLLIPRSPAALRQLFETFYSQLHGAVVWLDDLDRYLVEGSLDIHSIILLIDTNTKIVATMRSSEFDIYRQSNKKDGTNSTPETLRNSRLVLDQAKIVHLDSRLSVREIERARSVAHDTRILGALAESERWGFGEYLIAGPFIIQEMREAHSGGHTQRLGATIIDSAIGCRKLGYPAPIGIVALRTISNAVHKDGGNPPITDEEFQKAIDWATSPRFGAISPLESTPAGDFKAFDYLLEAGQDFETDAVATAAWDTLIEHGEPRFFRVVALRALGRGRLDVAEQLAQLMLQVPGLESVARLLLGEAAEKRRDFDTAETLYHRMLSDGDAAAHIGLARMNLKLGRTREARRWCKSGINVDDQQVQESCLVLLGQICIEASDDEGAARNWHKAAKLGSAHAASLLAKLYDDWGEFTCSVHWRNVAAERGSGDAAVALGQHSLARGNLLLAEQWFKTSRSSAVADKAFEGLALIARQRGHHEEEVRHWRSAAELGNPHAQVTLAALLRSANHKAEAEEWLHKAVESHYPQAMIGLALLHMESAEERGKAPSQECFQLLESAWTAGESAGAYYRGIWEHLHGKKSTAIRWLQRAHKSGHVDASFKLAKLLENQGSSLKAEEILRSLIPTSNSGQAMLAIGKLYLNRGQLQEARTWFSKSFDDGCPEAQELLLSTINPTI